MTILAEVSGSSLHFDEFVLDTASFELRRHGDCVPMEPRAFDLLNYLVEHRSRVVSKEELLDSLWGDRFVSEAALTTALRTARIAIGDSGKEQRLIRTVLRRGYQFVGTIDERGAVPDAVDAHRTPSADRGSLPARLVDGSGLGFAGRHDEIGVLNDVCKEVLALRQHQLVLVSGEAGIGKTTLCSVVAAAAHRDGAIVLYGRCDEDLSIPYQPWREVITDLARDMPDALAGRHDALAPLLGGTVAADLDSDSARFALYSAVIDVLDDVSASDRLTLVVLDDLHWADAQTLALVRHLVQRAPAVPVAVVATFRDTDADASHPLHGLLAAAHRHPNTTRLALDHLDDAELLTLLESLAGHEMNDDGLALRDALRAETEGNPFFVTEILRHLTETGALSQQDDGEWSAAVDMQAQGLPVSVREVVSRRVERLGPDTRRALETASVIGREFELDLLAELLDENVGRTLERLTPAIDNALISDAAGRFAFAHAIVAHTLYREIGPTQRAFGHEAVAVAIGQRHADNDERAAEIALHWIRAIGGDSDRNAANYSKRAADHALAQLAPDEAVAWYRRALELLSDDAPIRCELLVGLGTAQRQAGDPAHRETLLQAGRLAIDLGNDDLLVRAALANNRGEVSRFGSVDRERIDMLRDAIVVRPDGVDGALLHAVLSIEMHDAADDDVEATATTALTLARDTGDDRIVARVVRLAESALRTPDALARRQAWLAEGIAAADRTRDPLLRGMLSMSHHGIALDGGDRETLDREQLVRDAFAQASPEPFVRWTNEQTRSTHLFLDGDLDGAEQAANEALDFGVATGQPEAFFGYAGQLFQIRRAQGRLGEVADEMQRVHEEDRALQVFRAGLAYMNVELGRESEARALAAGFDVSRGAAPQFWSTTLMLWAEVSHSLGLTEIATDLVPILERWKHHVANTGATTEGSIAHGLGFALAGCGRHDEAVAAYDLALSINTRLRAPLFVARTQLALAELLVDSDPARARTTASDARAAIDDFDFARVRRRLDLVLGRLADD